MSLHVPVDQAICLAGSLCPRILDGAEILEFFQTGIFSRAPELANSEPRYHSCAFVGSRNHIVLCGPNNLSEIVRLSNLLAKITAERHSGSAEQVRHLIRKSGAELIEADSHGWKALTIETLKSIGCDIWSLAGVTQPEIEARIEALWQLGELAPPFGCNGLGLFTRSEPICTEFGYSRGTPVDRYYLERFLEANTAFIRGQVLDVGSDGFTLKGFAAGLESITTIDANPDMNPDVIGDVHNRRVFRRASFDCVLLLNVLEHCRRPQVVIDNVQTWLRKGGTLLAAIPNAQRIHAGPVDCWRILPDGCRELCKNWNDVQITTFGNCATSLAALSGLAVEDLVAEIRDYQDARYPVLTCIRATVITKW